MSKDWTKSTGVTTFSMRARNNGSSQLDKADNNLLEFGGFSLNPIVQRGLPLTLTGLRYLLCNRHILERPLVFLVLCSIQLRDLETTVRGGSLCMLGMPPCEKASNRVCPSESSYSQFVQVRLEDVGCVTAQRFNVQQEDKRPRLVRGCGGCDGHVLWY
jgi:hypothetical protein